ncbi:MAG: cytochrome c family protein [Rhodospirillales bacterium CG15_BIG_FIL_POST_REV_8_21_14_020_66_15]|nr:MAG: cytochrome c family protein [Rhodospirillales bacterium CG15_BIG_FIL_POST_REV_8_21_14_020_66_15]
MTRTRIFIGALVAALAISSHAKAAGDAAKGEKVFRKCAACHSLEAGKIKVGPPLDDLFGRKSGSIEGFRYSKAMKSAGIVWTPDTLDRYLAAPREVVPGNRMPFPGLSKERDRADLIAFLLKTLAAR